MFTNSSSVRRVLLLDDHRESRCVMGMLLRTHGYEVIDVASVLGALAEIETFSPHAIVFEWNLRTGGGPYLVSKLRAAAARRTSSPRLVILSTQAQSEDFSTRESVDVYLMKPIDFETLQRALEHPTGRALHH